MRLVPVLLAFALAACGQSADDLLKRDAKAAIATQLARPSSAQFESIYVSPKVAGAAIGVVCGTVSGENAGGMRLAPRRFLFGRDSGLKQIEYPVLQDESAEMKRNHELFEMNWRDSC